MKIGDAVILHPTQGGYQTDQTDQTWYVVRLTPKRVIVGFSLGETLGLRTFCKTTGKPFGYGAKMFPCYWLKIVNG